MNQEAAVSTLADVAAGKNVTKAAMTEAVRTFSYYVNKNLRNSRLRKSGWSTPDMPERDMSRQDREKAMALARQKVEESPIAFSIVDGVTAGIVGSGYRLSMRSESKEHNKFVESLWESERDFLDVRGMRSWGRLQRCWNMRRRIDGDVGLLRLVVDGKFYIQTIEADRIRKSYSGDTDDCGIDYDPATGRPMKFYVGPRITSSNDVNAKMADGKPYTPDQFMLYAAFPGERAELMRGQSQLTTNLNLFEDVEQIIENMVQKVKNASFIGLKFTLEKTESGMDITGAENKSDSEDGKTRKHVPMVAGMNLDLDQGEDASVLESNTPNSEFIPFINFLVRLLGSPFGFPLEMLMMNFTGLTYSSSRAMMELAKRRFRIEQGDLALASSWAFQGWYEHKVKTGIIKEDGVTNPIKHQWSLPPWPYINPTDEIQAFGMALDRNLTTMDAVLNEIGDYDFEDIVAQRAYEKSELEAAGLPFVTGQGVVVNKPEDVKQDQDTVVEA